MSALNLRNFFLIAMPMQDNSFFQRAVAYVCEHDINTGSKALVINQATPEIQTSDIFEQLNIYCKDKTPYLQPVLRGGPVGAHAGFVMHPNDRQWKHTQSPSADAAIAITSSTDILHSIGNRQYQSPTQIILGYSEWSSGQLEQDIANNHWLICPADPSVIFATPIEQRWQAALSIVRPISPLQLSPVLGHA